MKEKKIVSNAIHFYIIMTLKIFVPFLIMPYLSRVLSTDQYAVYTYTRAIITFINLIIDYGFIYSGTQKVSKYRNHKKQISKFLSEITMAKIILFVLVMGFLVIYIFVNKELKAYSWFSFIVFSSNALINMLPDYVFRGVEKIEVLSKRMLFSKVITTVLLFIIVKNETNFLWVAILEFLNAIIMFGITFFWLKKEEYSIALSGTLKGALYELKRGFNYFVFTAAPSLYGALNTIVIGNYLSKTEIIYWGTAWNIISAIMNLYTPISNAIFPQMVRSRDKKLIRKIMFIFLPIIFGGCIILSMHAKVLFLILAGNKYLEGFRTLILLTPVAFFAFIAIIYGAPVLGAMGKDKELKYSTLITTLFHILGLILLCVLQKLTLRNVCILRVCTEIVGVIMRTFYVNKYKLI